MAKKPRRSITNARHPLYLQTKTMVPDGEGGFKEGWTNGDLVWANITAIQARQQYEFNSVNVDVTHRMEIDGQIQISEEQRLRMGGAVPADTDRIFEIKTIENIEERGIVKVVTCRELR